MTPAAERFHLQTEALSAILFRLRYQKEKGLYFYKNKARDVLFRLEALCRAYREIHDKRVFELWYKRFKMLEDLLGLMDYHESLWQEFSRFGELKRAAEKIYLNKFRDEAKYLSDVLRENGWQDGSMIREFSAFLNSAQWKPEEEDARAFGTVMGNELEKVAARFRSGELNPYKLEEGVHEFRRKIRWVSIYAAASNGLVQIRKNELLEKKLHNYCTPEVVASPFNTMPERKGMRSAIVIQSGTFYALSWMIAELADLKDTGFRYENFINVLNASGKQNTVLKKKFLSTLGRDPLRVCEMADMQMHQFVCVDMIPELLCRDIKRSI